MPDQEAKAGSAASAKTSANTLTAAMIVGAIMLVVVGTMLPALAGLTDPEATWIPLVFYALAAAEVLIAFYLRAMIKRTQRSKASSGGTIQRQ